MQKFSELFKSKDVSKEKTQAAREQAKEILVQLLRVEK